MNPRERIARWCGVFGSIAFIMNFELSFVFNEQYIGFAFGVLGAVLFGFATFYWLEKNNV